MPAPNTPFDSTAAGKNVLWSLMVKFALYVFRGGDPVNKSCNKDVSHPKNHQRS